MLKFLIRCTMSRETPPEIRYEMQNVLDEYYYNRVTDDEVFKKYNYYKRLNYCYEDFFSAYLGYMAEKKYVSVK